MLSPSFLVVEEYEIEIPIINIEKVRRKNLEKDKGSGKNELYNACRGFESVSLGLP